MERNWYRINNMKDICVGLLLCAVAGMSMADDVYITPQLEQGAETFNKKLLEDQYYNQCLLTCSQSEDPNCPDNCRKLAKDKAEVVESRE